MRRETRGDRVGHPRRDRGAAVVEAAIVTPVVLGVILLILEGGFLLFNHLTVNHAVTDAARVAIVARNDEEADARILHELRDRTVGVRRDEIDRIVIFRADSFDDVPAESCITEPVIDAGGATCSVYGAADLDRVADHLTCGWCPSDRNERELIGVWVRVDHRSLTGLTPEITLTDQAILAIEYDT